MFDFLPLHVTSRETTMTLTNSINIAPNPRKLPSYRQASSSGKKHPHNFEEQEAVLNISLM